MVRRIRERRFGNRAKYEPAEIEGVLANELMQSIRRRVRPETQIEFLLAFFENEMDSRFLNHPGRYEFERNYFLNDVPIYLHAGFFSMFPADSTADPDTFRREAGYIALARLLSLTDQGVGPRHLRGLYTLVADTFGNNASAMLKEIIERVGKEIGLDDPSTSKKPYFRVGRLFNRGS